jgi:hypothetical protein
MGFAATSRLRHLLSGGLFVKFWDVHTLPKKFPGANANDNSEKEQEESLKHFLSTLQPPSLAEVSPEQMRSVADQVQLFAMHDPIIAKSFGFPMSDDTLDGIGKTCRSLRK